ncbi:MAG: hypothetical protein HC844_08860 [Tabrizicola sp.]|nr:hypothetical protein [Tabrizicola sp.]
MHKFRDEAALIRVLDEVADSLSALGVEPIFLGECPNKFNDAFQDDLWYAVQAGEEYWEQSHFFEYRTEPLVRERSSFAPGLDPKALKDGGATIVGDRIARLRGCLHHLQQKGWRDLVGFGGLIALIIEKGQRWLVLERPNVDDAEIYSWGEDGLFDIGKTERIDQEIEKPTLLRFKHVEQRNVDWLGDEALRYFRPVLQDTASATRLAEVLWDAVTAIRGQTSAPFALLSKASPTSFYGGGGRFEPPQVISDDLRQKEGEFRRPDATGKWPQYRPDPKAEPAEYSDLAKAMHTALAILEDADWRKHFSTAFGENLSDWQLGLLANADIAVLIRDNAAFRIEPGKLSQIGVFDYISFFNFDGYLPDIEEAARRAADGF